MGSSRQNTDVGCHFPLLPHPTQTCKQASSRSCFCAFVSEFPPRGGAPGQLPKDEPLQGHPWEYLGPVRVILETPDPQSFLDSPKSGAVSEAGVEMRERSAVRRGLHPHPLGPLMSLFVLGVPIPEDSHGRHPLGWPR